MEVPIVNHLFLTDRFVIKGRVRTGDRRLSIFLEGHRKPMVTVEDVTLIDLDTRDRVVAQRGLVLLRDVVLAHELIDVGGDQHRKVLAEADSEGYEAACLYFRKPINFELAGKLRKDAIHAEDPTSFQVVLQPMLRRFETGGDPDLEMFSRLPYFIVQRAHVQCLLGL